MTVKTSPNVSDHYQARDSELSKPRALRQFILDAAIRGIQEALKGADDILADAWVECSGDDEEEPWQQFVVKFRHEKDDSFGLGLTRDVEEEFEFKLELNDSHDGYSL